MTWQIRQAMDLIRRQVGFRAVTSPMTDTYNCIAWAAGDNTQKWWPNGKGYWPGRAAGQNLPPTIPVFQTAFATLGYAPCVGPELEPGFEKIALYGKGGEVTHAALQLASGHWTSKLGDHADVEHDLGQIENNTYGTVVAYLRRLIP